MADCQGSLPVPSSIRVYSARRIHTMNASLPVATHVAVRDGRILGYGDGAAMAAFGPAELDDRFAAKVILPGFVEGHGHAAEGMMWRQPYVGFYGRTAPDGTPAPGLKSIEEVVARLQAVETQTAGPLASAHREAGAR